MIFFEDIKYINKNSDLYQFVSTTLENLYKQLNMQQIRKKNLIIFINKIIDFPVNHSSDLEPTTLLSIIEKLKSNLKNVSTNIENIHKLISDLKDIMFNLEHHTNSKNNMDLSTYYLLYIAQQNTILQSDLRIESLLSEIYPYSNLNIPITKIENQVKNNEFISPTTESPKKDLSPEGVLADNDTLIISEVEGKVFLPFKVSDLEIILKENQKKYTSIDDLINKNYIFPLSKYKNSPLSRFREAFILMREREKASFIKSIDLAFELIFKYNLDPIVIAACKNLDELDVYLDCLEDMTLDEFNIFHIKYER